MAACGGHVNVATCGVVRTLLPQAASENERLRSSGTHFKVPPPYLASFVSSPKSAYTLTSAHTHTHTHFLSLKYSSYSEIFCVFRPHSWHPGNLDPVTPTKTGSGNTPHIPGENTGFEGAWYCSSLSLSLTFSVAHANTHTHNRTHTHSTD